MDVKTRELREKGFVRIRKQRREKEVASGEWREPRLLRARRGWRADFTA
jgi:hypothetical protein